MVVNLTGSNLLAMVALAQMALWMAMLVRAGQLAVGPRTP